MKILHKKSDTTMIDIVEFKSNPLKNILIYWTDTFWDVVDLLHLATKWLSKEPSITAGSVKHVNHIACTYTESEISIVSAEEDHLSQKCLQQMN